MTNILDAPSAHDLAEVEARVIRMMPLVRHVVADVAGRVPRFVDREDLIAAGMLGLTQAAGSFDAARGVSFQIYARVRVRGAILDELRSGDWLSRGARSRANDMKSVEAKLVGDLGRRPSDDEIAHRMAVEVSVVLRTRHDVDRAAELERSGGSSRTDEIADRLPAFEPGPLALLLEAELRGYLIDSVAALPERLRTIVVGHFFDGRQMRDIADELSVTASRVSQLCGEAIDLLRDGLNVQFDPDKVIDLDVTKGRVARRKAAYYKVVSGASTLTERLDAHRSVHDAIGAPAA